LTLTLVGVRVATIVVTIKKSKILVLLSVLVKRIVSVRKQTFKSSVLAKNVSRFDFGIFHVVLSFDTTTIQNALPTVNRKGAINAKINQEFSRTNLGVFSCGITGTCFTPLGTLTTFGFIQ